MSFKNNLSIQFVSQITGINPHTIRAWEKRYQCLIPARDKNGRRLYNEQDVNKLKILQDLVNHGNNISEIAKLTLNDLEKIHKKYIKDFSLKKIEQKNDLDINKSLQDLLMALHSYRLDIISHELLKIKAIVPARDLALNLLCPLLREIGENVNGGLFSIAQEHALSSLLRFHIGQILSEYISITSNFSSHSSLKTFLITTPENERHEFGILIAALLCCHYNIKFYYLGVDLPYLALSEAAQQIKPNGIILGASKEIVENRPEELSKYIKNLRETLDSKITLMVGGAPAHIYKGKSKNIEFLTTFQLLDMKLANI